MRSWRVHQAVTSPPRQLLEDAGVYGRLPVHVRELATAMGVAVRLTHRTPAPDWSGALEFNDGTPTIWVRRTDSRVHQRFTVAHEIGHLILHPQIKRLHRDLTFRGDHRETEANRYAAELLMPRSLLRPLAAKERSLRSLARRFWVSELAMKYRLKSLGISDIAP